MKKPIIAIAVMSMILSLTGCGEESSTTATQSGAKTTTVASETTTAAAGATEMTEGTKKSTDSKAEQTTASAAEISADNTASSADTDIALLVGEWDYQQQNSQNGAIYDDAGTVTVAANSTYTYQPKDGSAAKNGTIKVDYDEYSNGDKVPFWSFYDNDGSFFIGLYCTQNVPDTFYIGNGGAERLVRKSNIENPFDEYIGQWKSESQWNGTDFYIQISRNGESMNAAVSAHSAVADYQWNYTCTCSDDGTYIECTGGGTLNRTDYAPDGNIQEPVTVYSDGTARFNIKGGILFWEECKEGTARQVGFSRIG